MIRLADGRFELCWSARGASGFVLSGRGSRPQILNWPMPSLHGESDPSAFRVIPRTDRPGRVPSTGFSAWEQFAFFYGWVCCHARRTLSSSYTPFGEQQDGDVQAIKLGAGGQYTLAPCFAHFLVRMWEMGRRRSVTRGSDRAAMTKREAWDTRS